MLPARHRLMLASVRGRHSRGAAGRGLLETQLEPAHRRPRRSHRPGRVPIPGTTLYNGTRWPWVNGGERIDVLYKEWLNLVPSTRRFTSTRRTATLGSIRGWTEPALLYSFRTRRRYGRILHRRRRPDLYLHHANMDRIWKAGVGSATRIRPIPNTSIECSGSETEAANARISR